jgi:transcriptional regulator with XRE-family HTH domain
MTPRKAGKRGTPERVIQLLQEEVNRTSQAATARATGLTLKGVQNYLKGIGEPTTATLEKLAYYFVVSVAWLRGEETRPHQGVTMSINDELALMDDLLQIYDLINNDRLRDVLKTVLVLRDINFCEYLANLKIDTDSGLDIDESQKYKAIREKMREIGAEW